MNIYLSKKYIESNWSDEAVAVYIALRKILRKDDYKCYISFNMIYYVLCGKFKNQKPNRYFMDKIKIGLSELINIGVVSYVDVVSVSEFVLDLSRLELDTKNAAKTEDYFVIVQDTEIHTIMNSNYKQKFKLCRYFVFLVGTFNSKSQLNFTSLEYLVSRIKISEQTIIEYNRILEEKKLIYIYRANMCIRNSSTGEISKITNTYGRYTDKDKVIQAGESHANTYGYDPNEKKTRLRSGKENRSASAKYYAFCKGKEYDYNTLKSIYLTLEQFNKDLSEKFKSDEYKKDLTVFKDYDFYCKENTDDDTCGENGSKLMPHRLI